MSEAFDPYVKWLGIRDAERPPNHYRLLGLDVHEGDPDVIATAADRQMGHVRKFQQGPHAQVTQRLLNELAAARLCLLNPETKSVYDSQLRANGSGGQPAATGLSEVKVRDVLAPSQTRRMTSRSRLNISGLVCVVLFVAAVVLLSVVYFRSDLTAQRGVPLPGVDAPITTNPVDPPAIPRVPGPLEPTAETVPPKGAAAATPSAAAQKWGAASPDVDDQQGPPPATPPRQTPIANLQTPRPSSDNRQPARRDPTLAAIRDAMSSRDVTRARRQLAQLHATARTLEERERADRVELLLFQLERFWSSVRRALEGGVAAGDQLVFQQRTTKVTSVNADAVVLELPDGSVASFATAIPVIDSDLAVALVRHQLPSSSPTTDLIIGVFLALDSHGDVARARALMVDAKSQGIPVDVLFPYWESRKLGEAVDASLDRVDSSSASGTLGPLVHNRLPVPDDESQAAALREIRTLFDTDVDIDSPTAHEQQAQLAGELYYQAVGTHDRIAARFVLLKEALKLSLQGASAKLAVAAYGRLAGEFDLDASQLLIDEFTGLSRQARTPEQRVRVCQTGMFLVASAVTDEDYETALRLATLTHAAARKSRQSDLESETEQRREHVLYLRQQLEQVQPPLQQLASDPESEAANLAVGRYYCFARGEFGKGLLHLSRGSDQQLKELAVAELEGLDTPDKRVQIADQWWKLSENEKDLAQSHLRAHAGELYRQAIGQLTGITKKRIAARLQELIRSVEAHGKPEDVPRTLFSKLWRVEWEDHPTWGWARFTRDGSVTTFAVGKEWHNEFQIDRGLILIESKDGKSLFTIRPTRDRLWCGKHDRQTGQLKCRGIGIVIGEASAIPQN